MCILSSDIRSGPDSCAQGDFFFLRNLPKWHGWSMITRKLRPPIKYRDTPFITSEYRENYGDAWKKPQHQSESL